MSWLVPAVAAGCALFATVQDPLAVQAMRKDSSAHSRYDVRVAGRARTV
jgi:hypothetical protein